MRGGPPLSAIPRPHGGRPAVRAGLGLLLVVPLLAGCAADRPYGGLNFPFSGRYQAAAGAPVLLSNDLWWRRLEDPTLDRLVALLAGRENIREVIAFPKATSGADPLTGAPAPVEAVQLRELGLRLAQ